MSKPITTTDWVAVIAVFFFGLGALFGVAMATDLNAQCDRAIMGWQR